MAVTNRHIGRSTYSNEIVFEIIEKDGASEELLPVKIIKESLNINYLGDRLNMFETLYPSTLTCDIIMDDSTAWLFDALINEDYEEGKYFIKMKKNGSTIFIGMIVVEGMQKQDTIKPAFRIKAIDGLTALKGVKFDIGKSYPFIFESLTYIFNKLQISFLQEEIKWAFQSDLIPNTTFYSNNLAAITFNANYYAKSTNEVTELNDCYTVLIEILKRIDCYCYINNGIAWIFGQSTRYRLPSKPLYYYRSDETIFATDTNPSVNFSAVNLSLQAEKGGIYTYSSGFKQVDVKSEAKYSNRKNGFDKTIVLGMPNPLQSFYTELGLLPKNESYTVEAKLIVSDQQNWPSNVGLSAWISIREINLTNSVATVLVDEKRYDFPSNSGSYLIKIPITSVSYDRSIDVKFRIGNIGGTTTGKVTINTVMAENLIDKDKIVTRAFYANSKLTKTKEVTMLGNQTHGDNSVKMFFWDKDPFKSRSTSDQWKIDGDASLENLEVLIAKKQLIYSGNSELLEIMHSYVNQYYTISNRITYSGVNYSICEMTVFPFQDRVAIVAMRVNDPRTGSITVENDVPISISNFNLNNSISNAALLTRTVRIYERNFNGNSFVIEYPFKTGYSIDSLNRSVDIFINGNKMVLKQDSTLSPIHQVECYLNLATKTLTTPVSYTKAKLEIIIRNHFEELAVI